MTDESFDVLIIGGGPGGYTAAIRASQLGMRVALVEREALGGVCLNWGCIPTKALLRTAEIYASLHELEAWGLAAAAPTFDAAKVVKRSRDAAAQLNRGVTGLMRKNGVRIHVGTARLAGPGAAVVTEATGAESEIRADHIILATGARPRTLRGIEPDGRLIWTYREAMVPAEIPRRLLVVGSGAIGIEFASFYRAMGAEVTVVEVLPQILPAEDAEVATFARTEFERRGIRFATGATAAIAERDHDSLTVNISAGESAETLTVDRAISAVGVQGNVDGLGLEGTAVKVDRGFVLVDEWLRTGEPGVYAIGDVAGPPCLAHKAAHEGVVCVERIAGVMGVRPLDRRRVPACTYSSPQLASIGFTEASAREAGHDLRVGRFPFAANGKAIALGEARGLVKTIFDASTGELLGAHMVGEGVTELIHGFAIAMTLEATEESLMGTIFPHPTLSEMLHESVLAAYGRALNI